MEVLNLSMGKFSDKRAISVNGLMVDIGCPVFRWDHKNGFNGYTTETVVIDDRKTGRERVIKGPRYRERKGGVDAIKQYFIHHSGGDGKDPRNLYNTLYNDRGLSVQFGAEDDGRIFQFNDVIDHCYHAGKNNGISFGVEACLYPLYNRNPNYYSAANRRRTGNLPHRTKIDVIHGQKIKVFCFTDEQMDSMARLGAGVWVALKLLRSGSRPSVDRYFDEPPVFPRVNGKIPRTVIDSPLKHVGMIGHLQQKRKKIDPAGFEWEKFERLVSEYYIEFVERVC